MKEKIVMVLAVLLMAAPAMAVVNFTAEDVGGGSGQLKISYICDDGEEPRGIALKVTLSGGNGHISSASDVKSTAVEYNTYIDWANSNPVSYAVGDGHPLADPTGAGVVTFPATEFSICMGVLDETGYQLPGPGTCTNLITIQLHGDSLANVSVTVDADYSRAPDGGGGGGAVGSPLDTNLPLSAIDVAMPIDCMKNDFPPDVLGGVDHYMNWVYWNKPDCWCYIKQCNGDADGCLGPGLGPFVVSQDDLEILRTGINVYTGIPAGAECADFDHETGPGLGPFWISQDDLDILRVYINIYSPTPPDCDGTHYNRWITPDPASCPL